MPRDGCSALLGQLRAERRLAFSCATLPCAAGAVDLSTPTLLRVLCWPNFIREELGEHRSFRVSKKALDRSSWRPAGGGPSAHHDGPPNCRRDQSAIVTVAVLNTHTSGPINHICEMPGAGEAPATAKRKAADSRDSNADADREAGAAEQPAAKRTRAGSEDQAMSTCRQGGPGRWIGWWERQGRRGQFASADRRLLPSRPAGRPADGPMRGHGVEVVLPADKAAEGQEFDSGTREAAAAAAGQTGDRATPDLVRWARRAPVCGLPCCPLCSW